MSEKSTQQQIEQLLRTQPIYRLGCYADGRQYIIPMTAAFHEGAIYSFSHEGTKMSMMRSNPEVCVEFEQIAGPTSWESVVAWGTFEELQGDEAQRGAKIILERLAQLPQGKKNEERIEEAVSDEKPAIVFRIRLREMTGRSENS